MRTTQSPVADPQLRPEQTQSAAHPSHAAQTPVVRSTVDKLVCLSYCPFVACRLPDAKPKHDAQIPAILSLSPLLFSAPSPSLGQPALIVPSFHDRPGPPRNPVRPRSNPP